MHCRYYTSVWGVVLRCKNSTLSINIVECLRDESCWLNCCLTAGDLNELIGQHNVISCLFSTLLVKLMFILFAGLPSPLNSITRGYTNCSCTSGHTNTCRRVSTISRKASTRKPSRCSKRLSPSTLKMWKLMLLKELCKAFAICHWWVTLDMFFIVTIIVD